QPLAIRAPCGGANRLDSHFGYEAGVRFAVHVPKQDNAQLRDGKLLAGGAPGHAAAPDAARPACYAWPRTGVRIPYLEFARPLRESRQPAIGAKGQATKGRLLRSGAAFRRPEA